jgi:hypothetical protein
VAARRRAHFNERDAQLARLDAQQTFAMDPSQRLVVSQQQALRLVSLIHARLCHASAGACGFKLCDDFRRILPHIGACQAPDCALRHCVSSRYCIAHYNACRDAACAVCEPARKYSGIVQQRAASSAQASSALVSGAAAGGGGGGDKSNKNTLRLSVSLDDVVIPAGTDLLSFAPPQKLIIKLRERLCRRETRVPPCFLTIDR